MDVVGVASVSATVAACDTTKRMKASKSMAPCHPSPRPHTQTHLLSHRHGSTQRVSTNKKAITVPQTVATSCNDNRGAKLGGQILADIFPRPESIP